MPWASACARWPSAVPKKVPQTEAIFANVQEVHGQAAADEHTLRLSLDSKAPVPIGPFSRGGQSRTGTRGVDHDFKPDGVLTPFGLFQPQTSASALFFTDAKVTSDFMADCLEQWLAGAGRVLEGGAEAGPGPGQWAGEQRPAESVALAAGAAGAEGPVDGGGGVRSTVPQQGQTDRAAVGRLGGPPGGGA